MTPMWVMDSTWKLADVVTAYSGAPLIASVVATDLADAAVWHIDVCWTMSLSDDTQYKVEVWWSLDRGAYALLWDDQTTYTDTVEHDTGVTGSRTTAPPGTQRYAQYKVRVYRKIDDALIQEMASNEVAEIWGPAI
jgi:hypothetical protein